MRFGTKRKSKIGAASAKSPPAIDEWTDSQSLAEEYDPAIPAIGPESSKLSTKTSRPTRSTKSTAKSTKGWKPSISRQSVKGVFRSKAAPAATTPATSARGRSATLGGVAQRAVSPTQSKATSRAKSRGESTKSHFRSPSPNKAPRSQLYRSPKGSEHQDEESRDPMDDHRSRTQDSELSEREEHPGSSKYRYHMQDDFPPTASPAEKKNKKKHKKKKMKGRHHLPETCAAAGCGDKLIDRGFDCMSHVIGCHIVINSSDDDSSIDNSIRERRRADRDIKTRRKKYYWDEFFKAF